MNNTVNIVMFSVLVGWISLTVIQKHVYLTQMQRITVRQMSVYGHNIYEHRSSCTRIMWTISKLVASITNHNK